MKFFVLLSMLLWFSGESNGCPLCKSATAYKIRASLLGPGMLWNMFYMVLPFIIFAAIIYVTYYGFPVNELFRQKTKWK
ncbi:MAG: hypothetical protein ABIN94_15485 [Ferruginibacter sp.]